MRPSKFFEECDEEEEDSDDYYEEELENGSDMEDEENNMVYQQDKYNMSVLHPSWQVNNQYKKERDNIQEYININKSYYDTVGKNVVQVPTTN